MHRLEQLHQVPDLEEQENEDDAGEEARQSVEEEPAVDERTGDGRKQEGDDDLLQRDTFRCSLFYTIF